MHEPVSGPTQVAILAGRYEVGEVLGRGGMGEVRAGRDLRLGRAVAVKRLRAELAGQPEIRRRFEGEARAAARLTHPNVVAIHDVGEEAGIPFIVMERVTGPTLEQEMAQGPMDPDTARRIGAEILDALGAAHAAGIVHRDVKPGNVLLAADGPVKVADFGIAKAIDSDGPTGELEHTMVGQLVGTVAYMAPERVAGEPATLRSDLYSLGVVLYEALSGTRPFSADTPVGLAWAITNARPEPLADLRPGLSPVLLAVVERAMAREPEDRFASAAEMAAALRTEAPALDDAATVIAPGATATQVLDVGEAASLRPPSRAAPPDPATAPRRVEPGRRGSRRRGLLAVAVAGMAGIAAITASRIGDGASEPPATEVPAGPEAGSGIPEPLADALDRLEGTLR